MVTKAEMRELVKAGRTAMEYRLIGILIRPRALTKADEDELEAVKDMIKRYDELMAPYFEQPATPEAANDNDEGEE